MQDRIYAAGFATENGDSRMAVARSIPLGVLDPSFSTGGVATLNACWRRALPRPCAALPLQTDGKILIAGTAEAAAVPQRKGRGHSTWLGQVHTSTSPSQE